MKKIFFLPIILFSFLIFTPVISENVKAYESIKIEKLSNPTASVLEITDKGVKGTVNAQTGKNAFNTILTQYRKIISFISGMATLAMIMFFIFNFIQLGASQGNPQERQKAVTGLIISGISTSLLGSITLITGVFYKMFT